MPPPPLAATALALDRMFPPDLARYQQRSTEIVDADGRLLRAFTTVDGKWRLGTDVDQVDPLYLSLLKAYEDRRFDAHWGVDPLAAVRAAGQWMGRGRIVSGASTISMQAARLLEGPRPRSLFTKAIQSARAVQLEWRYSKREVMAIYLTLAPMGGNLEGVRAASLAYFGKEPAHLNAAEAALLVAIPQSPERRRPDRRPHSAEIGRDRVLDRGLEHGLIDKAAFDLAVNRAVPTRRLAMPMHAPHLSTWLAGQSPGTIVPTTIRLELQEALTQLASDERAQLADRAQIAMVVVDNRSGGVAAWLGGEDFFGRAGQVDLVRAHRSPGSALKPMIYALAFDDRTLHPETLVEDVPVRFREWLPRNFDHGHQGAVTVRRALQQSLNVPAVLALESVGPQRFLTTLRAAGALPGLPPGDSANSLGMALGSATVSPLELAGLYSRPRQWRRLRPAARAARSAARRAGPAAGTGGGLVRHRHPGRCAPARGFRLAAAGVARTPHRLQDRHLGGLPRCLGRGLQRQLDGRRLGRPCRRHAAPGPARPRRRAADRAESLRPPACAKTIAPPRRPPMCCAWPRGTTCRRACAHLHRWRRPMADRASPTRRPTRRSSSARAMRCRSAPTAAAARCAG